jgi:hypothetical protein
VDHHDLTGYYTYRSLLNRPEPADDFNRLRFGEGDLFLWVAADGQIRGTLGFPADPLAAEKDFMDVTGRVTGWAPVSIELEGVGRPGTGTTDFDYKHQATIAPSFADAIGQRPAFVGTVLRAKPHGTAQAGFTATTIAVRRDFLPARDIPGAALIPEAIAMLASRRHRLQHAVWHTVRGQWHALGADQSVVQEIDRRGWWPTRPPFLPTRALDLENGAGEDFLFMHRRMIAMVRDVYEQAGAAAPKGWADLPAPATPQTVYAEETDAGGTRFVFDANASGFMVPPPARDDDTDRSFKSPSFLTGVMRPLAGLFRSQRFLSALTLGQLGNLLEFTIHGWMHVRWTHTEYTAAGEPIGRETLFDIDPRWDVPSNDDLGDFYSSHVNPTFWRLHGWIDDRIADWEAANAGHVQPRTVDGVPWFAVDGHRVLVDKPFTWPGGHSHGHDGPHDEEADVRVMEEVMQVMRDALLGPAPAAPRTAVDTLRRPARLAFRELLLGVTLPEDH